MTAPFCKSQCKDAKLCKRDLQLKIIGLSRSQEKLYFIVGLSTDVFYDFHCFIFGVFINADNAQLSAFA